MFYLTIVNRLYENRTFMDIYELLQEENQRFWEVLDLDQSNLSMLDGNLNNEDESYIIEEIELV